MAEIAYFRLHDLIQLKSGNTPNKDEASFWDGNINWISASSMHSDLIYDSELKLTVKGSERTRVFAPNTIVILVRGSMLWNRIPICRLANKAAINQDVKAVLVINDKLDSDYLFHWLQAKESNIKQAVIGTGIGAGKLETDYLYNLQIGIPSLQRQSKTIRIFSAIDQKINLLTKKKQALEAYKKELIQKIFSQELRFKQEDGTDYPEWKVYALEDLLQIQRGASPRPIQSFVAEEGVNWIKIGDVQEGAKYITSTSQKITLEVSLMSRMIQPEDFVLSNSMSFGRPYISKIHGCIHDGWLLLRNNDIKKLSNEFLYELLSSEHVKRQFVRLAAGSTVNNLKSDTVRRVRVNLPSTNEQLRIVEILSSLSQVINQTDSKLSCIQKFKKGLLQQMFV